PPFGARVPYTAAVVDLAEGPRMMTELIEAPASGPRVGMRLRVAFRTADAAEGDAPAVPVFRPLLA
ncbi:OB-fold domain-containing protein, partial [Streptomyces sp. 4503]